MSKVKKIKICIVSGVVTLVLFIIISSVQSSKINESKMPVLVANKDISLNTKFDKNDFDIKYVSKDYTSTYKVVDDIKKIEKDIITLPIYEGQILLEKYIKTPEDAKFIEVDKGFEKISIKVQRADDAISYQMKAGDKINLYFVGKYKCVKPFVSKFKVFPEVKNDDDLCVVKLLENVKILGIYDKQGINIESNIDKNKYFDSIIIQVTPEMAQIINLLNTQGSLTLTGARY